jgi:hypothetical protein
MSLELDLGGRVAVVTGAASGLALEIARAIAEAGDLPKSRGPASRSVSTSATRNLTGSPSLQ